MLRLGFLCLMLISLLKFSSTLECEDTQTGTIVRLSLFPQIVDGVHNWQPLIDAHVKYPSVPVWVVLNVARGPGSIANRHYVSAINMLHQSGIKTMGLIQTYYGQRDQSIVEQEMDKWKTFYNVTGIHLNQMANGNNQSLADYFKHLSQSARRKGFKFIVGNPRRIVPEIYVDTVDTIIIHQAAGFPSIDQYCGGNANFPAKYWGIFSNNVTLSENKEKILAARNCVGFIYTTDITGSNPWSTLPPYLEDLFYLLQL